MRAHYRILAILILSGPWTGMAGQTPPEQANSRLPGNSVVTLYPPQDPITHKYSEDKACFSFKYGQLKEATKHDYDLGYGFLSLGGQDWFILDSRPGSRSVIKDLGKHKWDDSFKVPALKPLPEQPRLHVRSEQSGARVPGEVPRNIVISTSGGSIWGRPSLMLAKVARGHIYLVHAKNDSSDFYALFRVEDFEQSKYCTISWRWTAAPKTQPTAPKIEE